MNQETKSKISELCKKYGAEDDKNNYKCIVIYYGNNTHNEYRQPIYGTTVFENVTDAVVTYLSNCVRNYENGGKNLIKYFFDLEFEEGNMYEFCLDLHGIIIYKRDCDTCKEKSRKEKITVSKIHNHPVFAFGYWRNETNENDEIQRYHNPMWALIRVERIMPHFDDFWTLFYNDLVLVLLQLLPFCNNLTNLILSYISEWIPFPSHSFYDLYDIYMI